MCLRLPTKRDTRFRFGDMRGIFPAGGVLSQYGVDGIHWRERVANAYARSVTGEDPKAARGYDDDELEKQKKRDEWNSRVIGGGCIPRPLAPCP